MGNAKNPMGVLWEMGRILWESYEKREEAYGIPMGNAKNPMGVLKEVYASLDLEGFEQARPFFQNYVDQMKSYRKNRHEIDTELVKRIEKEWGFALEEWGYDKTLTS